MRTAERWLQQGPTNWEKEGNKSKTKKLPSITIETRKRRNRSSTSWDVDRHIGGSKTKKELTSMRDVDWWAFRREKRIGQIEVHSWIVAHGVHSLDTIPTPIRDSTRVCINMRTLSGFHCFLHLSRLGQLVASVLFCWNYVFARFFLNLGAWRFLNFWYWLVFVFPRKFF